jgi:hypothetical protein
MSELTGRFEFLERSDPQPQSRTHMARSDPAAVSAINTRSTRLTVGAANVRTSMMHYFDSRQSEITAKEMAGSAGGNAPDAMICH